MKQRAQRFLAELQERVFVCDGAMGTMLYSMGIPLNRCFEELNLVMPSLVKEVHEAYVRAGAELLETNTFGANPLRLEQYALADKCQEINRAGVRLARECAGSATLVAGVAGPLGVRLEPLGTCTTEQAREAFHYQILALAEAGADVILFETFYDLAELREAIAAARAVCDLPVIAQVTIDDDGNMLSGTTPENFTLPILEWGVDALGCNCSVGPKVMLEAIQRMAPLSNRPLTAQPNAGLPVNVGGRNIYLCSPSYMASYAPSFIRSGVKLLGGCCGTTPEHIRALKDTVAELQPPRPRIAVSDVSSSIASTHSLSPLPLAERSQLARKIAQREFVVVAEVLPPLGWEGSKEIEGARYLAQNGVDAVYLPEGPRSGARMSPLALACLIQTQAGVETLLQYTCRDRNLFSIQSDLLGAYALGLRNLVLTTGDPQKKGNYPDATAVFDVDSIGLTKIVADLNRGLDIGGNFAGQQTGFLIGVSANPGTSDFEQLVQRLETKLRWGAECVVTPPVFDLEQLDHFLERIRPFQVPVLAGLLPLTSYRNAEFLANEWHVRIPEPIFNRMREADSGEAARTEGIRIAQELALRLRRQAQGLLVSTPLGRYGTTVEVLGALSTQTAQEIAAARSTRENTTA
ncbi:MAG: bifunctional homocysteine S-methyltransferase/methylenetetrahydrofolate reductase [Acidobacteria bacterium]|nr:bifunctional homocysteine S-methyltransferase/methylenetetrahydrofolate reductase [Acidobacteriota bacterium]